MRARVTVGMLLVCLGALAGCASTSSSPSSDAPSAGSSPTIDASTISDGMVDIDSHRQIHVTCAGSTNPGPTVVLISGAQMGGDYWATVRKTGASATTFSSLETSDASVFSQTSRFAPVCSYDRPGTTLLDERLAPSTLVKQPTTAQQGVADLEAWLTAAQLAPPYVLVGHSWGGMIATLFAATYPSQTAGLVLVDPATVYLQDHLNDGQWQDFLALPDPLVDGSGKEAPDYRDSVQTVRVAQVGRIPVVVLTSDRPFNFGVGLDAWPAWLAAEDSLAKSLDAKHVTATSSGHMIPNENPAAVVAAIRDVVTQSR